MAAVDELTARRAGPEDVPALVRLRGVMVEALGEPSGPDDPWRAAAAAWFADQLQRPERFAAFVVDVPEEGVVAVAAGLCESRAPGPGSLSGMRGRVFNVATDPGWRRRGAARACLGALLVWFQEGTAAEVVELSATAEGDGLYRSLGFARTDRPVMHLRLPAGPR